MKLRGAPLSPNSDEMYNTQYVPVIITWLLSVALVELTFITIVSDCSFVFVEYANAKMSWESWTYSKEKESKEGEKKYNNRIHQEINVLLIMFKTIYDKANFTPFHKINTRERYLTRGTAAFFNLSWN